jgi:Mce-associated membrane protein
VADIADEDAERGSGVRLGLVAGLVVVLALAGLTGWLGYRAYESYQARQLRALFLQAGRQAAVNVTTVKYTEAEADVQRILDCSTGAFYDDFQRRAAPFVQAAKQAQSTSEGTVVDAALESAEGDHGRVLVAINVTRTNAGAPNQDPRAWRLRLYMQKVGDGAKVSQMEYVS